MAAAAPTVTFTTPPCLQVMLGLELHHAFIAYPSGGPAPTFASEAVPLGFSVPAAEPPLACPGEDFDGDEESFGIGPVVEFDASGSYGANDTQIVSYFWDFGDGTQGEGEYVEHMYQSGGEYTARLTVIDELGGCATSPRQISINKMAEGVITVVGQEPSFDYSLPAEVEVTFDGSMSYDPDGTIMTYEWFINDSLMQSGGSPEFVTTFDENDVGDFVIVNLVVIDDDSLVSTNAGAVQVEIVAND